MKTCVFLKFSIHQKEQNLQEESFMHLMKCYSLICKVQCTRFSVVLQLMEKGTKMVLEQVVTTLASVADTAEEKFTAYYDRFMPLILLLLYYS